MFLEGAAAGPVLSGQRPPNPRGFDPCSPQASRIPMFLVGAAIGLVAPSTFWPAIPQALEDLILAAPKP